MWLRRKVEYFGSWWSRIHIVSSSTWERRERVVKVFASPQTKSKACIWWWVIGTLTLRCDFPTTCISLCFAIYIDGIAHHLPLYNVLAKLTKKILMNMILTPCPRGMCAIFFLPRKKSRWVAQWQGEAEVCGGGVDHPLFPNMKLSALFWVIYFQNLLSL
jgi:hypothetical protein